MNQVLPIPLAELVAELLALPDSIAEQADQCRRSARAVALAEEALKQRVAALYVSGEINGTNDKARQAQERAGTIHERQVVAETQEAEACAVILLTRLRDRLAALRSVATIVGGLAA